MRVLAALSLALLAGCGPCGQVGAGRVGGGAVGTGATGNGGVGGRVFPVSSSCDASLPSGGAYGSIIWSQLAYDMNGNSDGNIGWADGAEIQDATRTDWHNGGSIGGEFENTAGGTDNPALEWPCAGTDMTSGPCIPFDGSDDKIDSTLAASAWKSLHDGTIDFTCYTMLEITDADPEATYRIMADYEVSNEKGIRWVYNDSSTRENAILFQQDPGSGTSIFVDTDPGLMTPQTRHIMRTTFELGAAGDDAVVYIDGVEDGSAETDATHSTANPTDTMRIGASPNNTLYLKGRFAQHVCYNAVHSAADAAIVEASMECAQDTVTAAITAPSWCTVPAEGTVDAACPGSGTCKIAVIGASNGSGQVSGVTASWQTQLLQHLTATTSRDWSITNFAVPGHSSSQVKTQYTANVQGNGYHVLFIAMPLSTIADDAGHDDAFDPVEDAAVAASGEGMSVIWSTNTPFEDYVTTWTAQKQTVADAVTASIMATGIPNVVPLDSHALLEDPSDADALRVSVDLGDGVHFDNTAHTCWAAVADALL